MRSLNIALLAAAIAFTLSLAVACDDSPTGPQVVGAGGDSKGRYKYTH